MIKYLNYLLFLFLFFVSFVSFVVQNLKSETTEKEGDDFFPVRLGPVILDQQPFGIVPRQHPG